MQLPCPYCSHTFEANCQYGDLVRCTACAKVFECDRHEPVMVAIDLELSDLEEWQAEIPPEKTARKLACPHCGNDVVSTCRYGDLVRCASCRKGFEAAQTLEMSHIASRLSGDPPATAPKARTQQSTAAAYSYNDYARRLSSYCDGIELPDEIIHEAYDQIVVEGEVQFPVNADAIHRAICDGLENIRSLTKEVYALSEGKPLHWPLYERCAELCRIHKIAPEAFYGLDPPEKPQSLAELLPKLKVAEMKALLQAHGHKAEKKRADIEQQILQSIPWEACTELVAAHHAAALAKHESACIKEQYEYLLRMILHRAYFLAQIARWVPYNIKHSRPVMSGYDVEADDKKLAKLLDGSGYSGVFKGKQIMKLLPLFPGDRMDVRFDYRR